MPSEWPPMAETIPEYVNPEGVVTTVKYVFDVFRAVTLIFFLFCLSYLYVVDRS